MFAKAFIEQVRNLAFFEFLTDWIFKWIEERKNQCEDLQEECNNLIMTIGSSELLKNSGAMAVAGVCIVIAFGILGLFFVIGKLSTKARSVYNAIYNAIVWNPIIRYVLQSTLKL